MVKEFKTTTSFSKLNQELETLLAQIDPAFFKQARWFQQKAAVIQDIRLADYTRLASPPAGKLLLLLILDFDLLDEVHNKKWQEKYYFPLLISKEELEPSEWLQITGADYQAYLYDGVHELSYVKAVKEFIEQAQELDFNSDGRLTADSFTVTDITATGKLTDVSSNSITLLQRDEIAKTFRRLQPGINPDLEISLNLQRKTNFDQFPKVKGYMSYQDGTGEEYSISLIQQFVTSEGDLWSYTQDHLAEFLKHLSQSKQEISALTKDYNQDYYKIAKQVGNTVANLHLALSTINTKQFKPRSPTEEELEQWYTGVKENLITLIGYLKDKQAELKAHQDLIEQLLAVEDNIGELIETIFTLGDDLGQFMRCHGDLHLEQILKQGSEIILLDFEGEPTKSIVQRRRKYSPLKDIAGLIRSYNYAAYAGYFNYSADKLTTDKLLEAVNLWEEEVVQRFLNAYLTKVRQEDNFLPPEEKFVQSIALFKLEKALYEALYEVNNRPNWLPIPLKGIIDCLNNLK